MNTTKKIAVGAGVAVSAVPGADGLKLRSMVQDLPGCEERDPDDSWGTRGKGIFGRMGDYLTFGIGRCVDVTNEGLEDAEKYLSGNTEECDFADSQAAADGDTDSCYPMPRGQQPVPIPEHWLGTKLPRAAGQLPKSILKLDRESRRVPVPDPFHHAFLGDTNMEAEFWGGFSPRWSGRYRESGEHSLLRSAPLTDRGCSRLVPMKVSDGKGTTKKQNGQKSPSKLDKRTSTPADRKRRAKVAEDRRRAIAGMGTTLSF